MRGRHAYAMLVMMGLRELIARDQEEYVTIVRRLCQDKPYHQSVRAQVRSNRSKLVGDRACIQALENFYRTQVKERLRDCLR